MTKSYSADLRKRVIEFVKSGSTQKQASEIFNISTKSIGRWLKKYDENGSYSAKKRGGSKRKVDLEALKEYVESHENMILRDAAEAFGFSIVSIRRWLKRMGYSYKKKASPTWKPTKKRKKNLEKK